MPFKCTYTVPQPGGKELMSSCFGPFLVFLVVPYENEAHKRLREINSQSRTQGHHVLFNKSMAVFFGPYSAIENCS